MKSLRNALDLSYVAVPKVAGGFCLVCLNIALMGWLGQDAFGAYSLCLAAIGLASEGLFGAAIDMSVLRLAPLELENNPRCALGIERSALNLKLKLMGCLSLPALALAYPLSRYLFHRDGLAHLVPISCIAALGMLALGSALLHLQIRSLFLRYGAVDLVHLAVKFGGMGLLMVAFNRQGLALTPALVLVCMAMGPLVAIGVFLCWHRNDIFLAPSEVVHSSRELLGFAKWYVATLLLASLISRVDLFLLTSLASIEAVGVYAAGQLIASIPLLIGTYLGIVFNPKVMPVYQSGRFFSWLCRMQLALLTICVSIYGFVFTFRSEIMEYILPAAFSQSASVILILLPATFAGLTSYPLAVSFLMFVRPRFLLQLDCVLLPFLIVSHIVLIPRYGAIGAAVATAAYGLVKTVIAQRAAFHWARLSPSECGLDFGFVENQAPNARRTDETIAN